MDIESNGFDRRDLEFGVPPDTWLCDRTNLPDRPEPEPEFDDRKKGRRPRLGVRNLSSSFLFSCGNGVLVRPWIELALGTFKLLQLLDALSL